MRSFVYTGDHGAVTLWGIQFPRGVATPVADERACTKLAGNRDFSEAREGDSISSDVFELDSQPPSVSQCEVTQGAREVLAQDPRQELDALRAQAQALGIRVHHKAGAETIKAAIAKAQG
ncbi:MAG: hypothetical protein RLZZ182_537 [Pseudomonadota bacterium]|jgi:hypothetical protein